MLYIPTAINGTVYFNSIPLQFNTFRHPSPSFHQFNPLEYVLAMAIPRYFSIESLRFSAFVRKNIEGLFF
jgi:hypothetical protein